MNANTRKLKAKNLSYNAQQAHKLPIGVYLRFPLKDQRSKNNHFLFTPLS